MALYEPSCLFPYSRAVETLCTCCSKSHSPEDKCMASHYTIYSINQESDLMYQISYIIYKISDLLYKICNINKIS